MRLTGSSQTSVTHGLESCVISSGVRSGSTSTGLAADTGPSWHTGEVATVPAYGLDRAADRPLRADDAPGRAAHRRCPPAFGLRAVPAQPADRPPVRRRGW